MVASFTKMWKSELWERKSGFCFEYSDLGMSISHSNRKINAWVDGENINKEKEPKTEAWETPGEDYD